jgi:hypothetical protein
MQLVLTDEQYKKSSYLVVRTPGEDPGPKRQKEEIKSVF